MRKHILLEKNIGETPLEALTAWKQANPRYTDVAASYAGRLDPMASGKLLILLGDECKRQDRYTGLDKEYEVEVLVDLASDTGDVLGLPSYAGMETHPSMQDIKRAFSLVRGTHPVPYPAFSSKTVAGKPLFLYMLEGTLDTIDIPVHDETIYRIRLVERRGISKDELAKRIQDTLVHVPKSEAPSKKIGADFRQDEIRAAWKVLFKQMPNRSFNVLRLRVTCASGTYMRTLASRMAKELSTTGLALSIHRKRIGRYTRFGMWLPFL